MTPIASSPVMEGGGLSAGVGVGELQEPHHSPLPSPSIRLWDWLQGGLRRTLIHGQITGPSWGGGEGTGQHPPVEEAQRGAGKDGRNVGGMASGRKERPWVWLGLGLRSLSASPLLPLSTSSQPQTIPLTERKVGALSFPKGPCPLSLGQ